MSILYREVATGLHLVRPSGPLNSGQAEALIHTFEELSAHGARRVIVALDDVPFIDSPGLAALIAGFRLFGNDGGDYRLVGAQDQPRLLFELTGFDRIFQTSDSLTETSAAEASIQAQPGTRRQVPVPQVALAV
jgi:anti-anti-sigma factor